MSPRRPLRRPAKPSPGLLQGPLASAEAGLGAAGSYVATRLSDVIGWGRKYSLFQYPFVTACCGMEFMSAGAAHHDQDRFGAAFPRFSPRQADMLMVVGTINHKISPVLLRVYEQMCEPKWVVSFGTCATSGGFYDNYATVQGIDTIIPVDVAIAGCPPAPESVFDAILRLQEKIQKQGWENVQSWVRHPNRAVKP